MSRPKKMKTSPLVVHPSTVQPVYETNNKAGKKGPDSKREMQEFLRAYRKQECLVSENPTSNPRRGNKIYPF